MTHSRPPNNGVGARLRKDMEQAGLSVRRLAQILAGEEHGPRYESRRRQLSAWLNLHGEQGMNDENALAVAKILNKPAERYVSSMYDELERAKRLAAYHRRQARLAEEEVRRLTKQRRKR